MSEVVEERTKYCKGCEKHKPLSDFHKCGSCKGGLKAQCKECRAAQQSNSYKRRMAVRGDEMRATWKRNHAKRAEQQVDPGETKFCPGCETEKPVSEFNKNAQSPDGLHSNCKDCRSDTRKLAYQKEKAETPQEELRAKWREQRAKRAGAALESTKRSYHRNRDYYLEKSAEYREQNPKKRGAHDAVESAVKRGLLPQQGDNQCSNPDCLELASEYHHWSYDSEHWLSVIPLCTSCHRLIHSDTLVLEDPESYAITPDNI